MDHILESMLCIKAFMEGGCEEVYERTTMNKEEGKKKMQEQKGEAFNEIGFETSYISAKIDSINKVLQSNKLMQEKDNRDTIANELIKLAEELKSL